LVDAETAEDVFFREVAEAAAQLRQGFARSVGMSPQRVQILVRLRRGGETSHSDLRQALGVDGATITRLVKELERDGLIARRIDPADNRYTLAALTAAGHRDATDLERRHQAYQEGLLRGVSRQHREQVLDTLRRLRANLTGEEAP
jgi:MarR family transcriptional regulator for hemolysin